MLGSNSPGIIAGILRRCMISSSHVVSPRSRSTTARPPLPAHRLPDRELSPALPGKIRKRIGGLPVASFETTTGRTACCSFFFFLWFFLWFFFQQFSTARNRGSLDTNHAHFCLMLNSKQSSETEGRSQAGRCPRL